jgi:ATP-dependent Clp protease ATP-binding subunit ClpA
MVDTLPYNEEIKRAIQIAQSISKEYQQEHFGSAHLLRAILNNEIGLTDFLISLGKDIYYLREWAEVRIEEYPKYGKVLEEPTGDDQIGEIMEEADIVRMKLSLDEIDPICVFAAISKPNLVFNSEQLKTFPASQREILDACLQDASIREAITPGTQKDRIPGETGSVKIKTLHKYCLDKTSLAQEGKINPIIGRERETRMMVEILGRRTKPNVLIVGEPGVGKTALVDGFALNIIQQKVPGYLSSALVFELDVGALVAGASYKGEVEDRLKNIIAEIKVFDKAILFIDEIHTLLDNTGPVGSGAVNMLKPELARGELTVIGATTNDEYREFIEPEEAFNRRFEILRVEEPDIDTATRMVKVLIPFYERHHNIKAAEGTEREAVLLAKRYIKDRKLPDAPIDLMDRTMASIRMMDETSAGELEALQKELDDLVKTDVNKLFEELKWFHRQLKNKISPILLSQLEDDIDESQLDTADKLITYLKTTLGSLKELSNQKKGSVERIDLEAVVSHKTGIPLGKIQAKEKEKLLNMSDELQKRVIGQDHAIQSLCEAVLESRSGLTKAGQPIGSFFLLGPTGTGKTELSKSLADFMFNDESALIRFDMSEFKEEHSAALLYGAPPGYVGYKEGGLLVNKIRENPYSILLFDEIEKAHTSVFDVFLQIMDEGKLHDRLGKEGDFSNAVILFTSNIGSDYIIEQVEKGNLPTTNELMEIMSRYFRPEFLARLTEIVPFAPIQEENVIKIFEIHLRKLVDTLNKQGINLNLSDEAKKFLALEGFSPKYGARPLTGVIRNQLRRPISKKIISGQVSQGSEIQLKIDKKGALDWKTSRKTKKSK